MILITGGNGLLGAHLLYELASKGEYVRVLKRATSDISNVERIFNHYSSDANELLKKIEWVDGDILDVFSLDDALAGIDKVYHCAAIVSFKQKEKDKIYKVNAEGTANVVNACLRAGVKKLCHVSSTAALGKSDRNEVITEETKWKVSKQNSNYSISKFNAEREVWRGTVEGLNAVMVNPCVILGPGNWDDSSTAMFKTTYNGLKFYTEGGNAFVDVRDVAKVMVQLMDSEIHSERFLTIGENLKFKTLFGMMAEEMGKEKPKIRVEHELSEFGWRYEGIKTYFTGAEPRITKEMARAAHQTFEYSNDKLKKAIGFEFTPIKDTIKNTVAFFRKNGNIK